MGSTKTFIDWLHWLEDIKCHICGCQNEEEWICERCDQVFCEDCSEIFTYHNQVDYNCCSICSEINF